MNKEERTQAYLEKKPVDIGYDILFTFVNGFWRHDLKTSAKKIQTHERFGIWLRRLDIIGD